MFNSDFFFFFQAEDGIRDLVRSRGLGDVYKRQGWVYAAGALISGGLFLAEAHRLHRHAVLGAAQTVLRPMRLFHYSITYLTAVSYTHLTLPTSDLA